MEKHLSFLPFTLNNCTGELRTNASIKKFVDGYFFLEVAAHSGYLMNASITFIKVWYSNFFIGYCYRRMENCLTNAYYFRFMWLENVLF